MEDRTNYHSALLEIRELKEQFAQCEKERDALKAEVERLRESAAFADEMRLERLHQLDLLRARAEAAEAERDGLLREFYDPRIAALEKRNAELVGALRDADESFGRSCACSHAFDRPCIPCRARDRILGALSHSERAEP